VSAGATVFFGLWLQKPMRIAAANPSGRRLADAIARCVELELLGPGGRFLQMTNAFSSPLQMKPLGLAGAEICRVWLNLLPAQIWAYSQKSEPLAAGRPS
jgi:phospholipid N-methyltransferase